MQTLIDKLQITDATNIKTTGYDTLLMITTGSTDYTGTKEEAEELKNKIIISMKDKVSDQATTNLGDQYINVRTVAGTKNAFIEAVLTKSIVASVTLPEGITATVNLLTLPSNSIV